MATRRSSTNVARPLGKGLAPTVHPSLQHNRAADLSSDSEDEEKLKAHRLTAGNPEAARLLLERRKTATIVAETRRRSQAEGATATHDSTVDPRLSVSQGMGTTYRGSLDPSASVSASRRRGSVAERKAAAQEVVQTRRATVGASRRASTVEQDEDEESAFVSMMPARTGGHKPSLALGGGSDHRATSTVSFAPPTDMAAGSSRRKTPGGATEDSGFSSALPLPGGNRRGMPPLHPHREADTAARRPVNSATYPHGDDSCDQGSVGHTASPDRANSATATRSASVPNVGAVVPGFKFGEGGASVSAESAGGESATRTRDKLRGLTKRFSIAGGDTKVEGQTVSPPQPATTRRNTTAKILVPLPGRMAPINQSPAKQQQGLQWYDLLLGPTLLEQGSTIPTQAFMANERYKYIALYFSAGWCPPCIEFTRILHQVYEKLKEKGFGLIFVSADKTEKKFEDHYRNMPWAAVPWRKDLHKIDEHFGVMGIPKVIVLFPDDGTIATREAAGFITHDDDAELTLLMKAVDENTHSIEDDGPVATSAGQTTRRRDQVKDSCALM